MLMEAYACTLISKSATISHMIIKQQIERTLYLKVLTRDVNRDACRIHKYIKIEKKDKQIYDKINRK